MIVSRPQAELGCSSVSATLSGYGEIQKEENRTMAAKKKAAPKKSLKGSKKLAATKLTVVRGWGLVVGGGH